MWINFRDQRGHWYSWSVGLVAAAALLVGGGLVWWTMPRQVTRTVTQYVTDCQVEIEVGKEYPLDHFERVSLTEDVFHDVSGQAIQVLFRVRDEYYNHLSRSAIKFFAADEVEFYVTDGESRFIQVEDLGGRRVIRIYAREAEPLDASPNTVYASCSHLNGD